MIFPLTLFYYSSRYYSLSYWMYLRCRWLIMAEGIVFLSTGSTWLKLKLVGPTQLISRHGKCGFASVIRLKIKKNLQYFVKNWSNTLLKCKDFDYNQVFNDLFHSYIPNMTTTTKFSYRFIFTKKFRNPCLLINESVLREE